MEENNAYTEFHELITNMPIQKGFIKALRIGVTER